MLFLFQRHDSFDLQLELTGGSMFLYRTKQSQQLVCRNKKKLLTESILLIYRLFLCVLLSTDLFCFYVLSIYRTSVYLFSTYISNLYRPICFVSLYLSIFLSAYISLSSIYVFICIHIDFPIYHT